MALENVFWNLPKEKILKVLNSSDQGISEEDFLILSAKYGENTFSKKKRTGSLFMFIKQFKNPIIIILLVTSVLSLFLQDIFDSFIIIIIILISSILGFWQEKRATDAIEELLTLVHIKTSVLRDGVEKIVKIEDIVPGDIVLLSAGSIIPSDCYILESNNLFVNEAMLTGETFPVEKRAEVLPINTPLSKRTNIVYMGTHVISGSGKVLVIHCGKDTEFGKISENLKLRKPETEFEHGIKRFGLLLTELTLILVISIFSINIYFLRPFLDSFLFSLALAVGLTPQLLPAIISVSLAQGAKRLADRKVIVKKLSAIENLGSMNILCSDKTGTLTKGIIQVDSAIDYNNKYFEKVFLFAFYNAYFQSGYINPIDEAIKNYKEANIDGFEKIDEIPYDFIRKRLSVLISEVKNKNHIMITKGAVPNVLEICSLVEISEDKFDDISKYFEAIQKNFEDLSSRGYRTIALAYKEIGLKSKIIKDDERDMIFLGFLILFDPLKEGIKDIIRQLNELGISLKIISGDNKLIANYIGANLGVSSQKVITGSELRQMSDEALIKSVNNIEIFAEVEPNQKEKILLALKKNKNVVGYMGDGINDAPALHSADVSISVDSAVDIAKDASEIVLLEKDLKVLVDGVREGRKTFANTMKYIFITTSANFGNMFSVAGSSLILPFLPMLPKQILITNLLTDFPAMAIGADNVDKDITEKPRRWNIKFILNFLIIFGLASSIFDFITFSVLLLLLKATPRQFQTGWFFISVITELLILFVLRTHKMFFKSRPGRSLMIGTLITIICTLILLSSPLGLIFGFVILPISFHLVLWSIILFYILSTIILKKIFYRYISY